VVDFISGDGLFAVPDVKEQTTFFNSWFGQLYQSNQSQPLAHWLLIYILRFIM